MKTLYLATTLITLISSSAAHAEAGPHSIAEILEAHNAYRTPLGLPPLHWSRALEARAQTWAEHLAEIGQLQHNSTGQNLAMATEGSQSLADLVNLWGNERADYTPGTFPNVSTTGAWQDVGHYSQIIWRDTRAVGCGFAEGNGDDILVCDYDPPGNIMGEPVD